MLQLLIFLLGFSTVWAGPKPELNYYTLESEEQIASFSSQSQFQEKLKLLLQSAHKLIATGADEILPRCQGERNCYSQIQFSYSQARKILFGDLHLEEDEQGYFIRCVYCAEIYSSKDFPSQPPGPGRIPNVRVLNTEHTWPQSKFSSHFSKSLQKTDLHALFPVTPSVNSSRGNLNFGEVESEVTRPCPLSKRGKLRQGRTVFEPAENHKGNVARALFYFSTRYNLPIDPLQESTLRRWHEQDPVDAFEAWRHNRIFEIQGNRNPFIDHPEWVKNIEDF